MSAAKIITKFDEKDAIMWGNEPVCIGHDLHQSPLFSSDTLAKLIESYPRSLYGIFSMGAQKGDRWYWRQGDLDGMSGKDVLAGDRKGPPLAQPAQRQQGRRSVTPSCSTI